MTNVKVSVKAQSQQKNRKII